MLAERMKLMDPRLQLTGEHEEFRAEVRDFLEAKLPRNWNKNGKPWKNPQERVAFLCGWQRKLNEAKLAAISWPVEYGGRGATLAQQIVYGQEMSRRSTPDVINRAAIMQIGPALIRWGSAEINDYFLPRILNAEHIWCLGICDPDAGSDLASMSTSAVDRGDHFEITGSKVWTSRAECADFCFLLARTDPNAPRHCGISAFILDMKEPGISVQPLKQISGVSGFNQLFFDKARVRRNRVVGEVNDGWRVAHDTLRYERAGTATLRADRRLEVLLKVTQSAQLDGQRRMKDPVVRERLARYSAVVHALREIGMRSMVNGLEGLPPGPETSVAKLVWSEVDQSMTDYAMELLGPYGTLQAGSPAAFKGGNPAASYLTIRAATIGGGTSEIQRNLIGERLLGLPEDRA